MATEINPAVRGMMELITSGTMDDDLDRIVEAVKSRRVVLDAQLAATMMVGDEVVYTDESWNGVTGKIVEKLRNGKFLVELTIERPERRGRRLLQPGTKWKTPVSMLRRAA